MMKFFRKHNKKLLAVFMCLLLIVWLGGEALTYMVAPNPGETVFATYVAGEITREQFNRARQETVWLNRLNLVWQAPFGRLPIEELDISSWFLLREEARRMGIRSSKALVETTFRKRGLGPEAIERIANRAKVKTDTIYGALAGYTDVVSYGNKMIQAATVNSAEVRRRAEDALSKVQVKAVVLRAEMFEDVEATFPEAEIEEQFAKYKDQRRSGIGLNSGYVLPPRVKVQYVRIDPQKIEEALSVHDAEILAKAEADLTPDEKKALNRANRYWKGHKQDPAFKRPPEEETVEASSTQPADDATTQPAEEEATTQPAGADEEPSTQPATAPAQEPEEESPFYTSWINEPGLREVALQLVRREEATERAQKLADWLKDQAAIPWDHAEVGTNGYKIPVEAVTDLDHYARLFDEARAGHAGTNGITISISDWISSENVLQVPGLGTSYLPNPAGSPIRFSQVVFNVDGLAEIPSSPGAERPEGAVYLALFQTCPYLMRDFDGILYVWRPVEVADESVPHDLEEVRDQVIADLRLARGFEQASVEAKRLYENARQEELQAAWEADSSLQDAVERYNKTAEARGRRAGIFPLVFVNRRTLTGDDVKSLHPIGAIDPAFLEACFGMRGLESAEPPVRTIDMPESATVVVAEWIKDAPLDETTFEAQQNTVAQVLERQRSLDYLSSWLEPKQIKARNRFELARGS